MASTNEAIPNEFNGQKADLNAHSFEFGDTSAEEWLRLIPKRRIKMYDFVSLYPDR